MAVKDTKPTPRIKRKDEMDEKPSPFSIDGIRTGAVQSAVVKGAVILSGLIMAGGLLIGGLAPGGDSGGPVASNPNQTIAQVGSETLNGGQLQNTFERSQYMGQMYGQKTTVASFLRDKQSSLKQLTDNAANVVAAQKAGISASEAEIDKKIDEFIADRLKPQNGGSEAATLRNIQREFGTVEDAKTKWRADYDRELVSKSILVEKLEKQIKDKNKVTEDDYKRSVTKLNLHQIVIRPELPKGNPKDFKAQSEKLALAAQSEATKLAATLGQNAKLPAFKAAALKVSDDEATKKKGGELGLKLPSEIYADPSFPEVLSQTPKTLVGPLRAADGAQYLFFIAGRKTELPKDYAKTKKKTLADFETQKDNEAWQKQQSEYQKAVTPEISDNALAAFQIQNEQIYSETDAAKQKTLREDALARYSDALKTSQGMEKAAISYQMAQLYRDLGQKPQQLTALKTAVESAPNDGNVILEYARLLRDSKPKEVLAQLKAASKAIDDNPSPPSMFGGPNPDDDLRQQLATEFDLSKEPKLAALERAKIKPAAPNPMMGGNMGGLQIQPGAQ